LSAMSGRREGHIPRRKRSMSAEGIVGTVARHNRNERRERLAVWSGESHGIGEGRGVRFEKGTGLSAIAVFHMARAIDCQRLPSKAGDFFGCKFTKPYTAGHHASAEELRSNFARTHGHRGRREAGRRLEEGQTRKSVGSFGSPPRAPQIAIDGDPEGVQARARNGNPHRGVRSVKKVRTQLDPGWAVPLVTKSKDR